ncbi:MAG: S-adenosylmethionine:tRNA ribosyltransferase-isomerase [Deltaproteobacteria bacterium]|nr:S-adenosylmethionine:tRNA ribosyltransferase-isomerase [Deltaproteobacteria bacterium]
MNSAMETTERANPADCGDRAIDLARYDFALPADRIAQQPSEPRDASKLLLLDRAGPTNASGCRHATFDQLPDWLEPDQLPDWLEPGDLLILNVTRVQPARLRGRRESGGAVEALLLGPWLDPLADGTESESGGARFRALLKLSGRLRRGITMSFGPPDAALTAQIVALGERGEVALEFEQSADPYSVGEAPLPPYIRRPQAQPDDRERYQTIYARTAGRSRALPDHLCSRARGHRGSDGGTPLQRAVVSQTRGTRNRDRRGGAPRGPRNLPPARRPELARGTPSQRAL